MKVDGQDVEAVSTAPRSARSSTPAAGKGPVFLVCETYRLVGHFVGDPQVYRPKGELQELRETQDPITKLREKLGPAGRRVRGARPRRRSRSRRPRSRSPRPGTDPKPEDALKNVYA